MAWPVFRLLLLGLLVVVPACQRAESGVAPAEAELRPPEEAATILDDLAHGAFRWFQESRHPHTGQVLDRHPNWAGRGARNPRMSSIAATGYHLSLLPEWVRLGWLSHDDAENQAHQALRFLQDGTPHHRGLFYHFIDWETGERWRRSEVSLLDSAILFNGCMVVSEAFGGQIARLADALLDRVEWPEFLVRHPRTGKTLLSLGWLPERGLLGPADVRSSEMAMPYFLAVGSRTHPIDAECWYNTDIVRGEVAGYHILNPTHPLFTSYYGLGWHDLEGRIDRDGVDLYVNARRAALANRAFCRGLAGQFRTFDPELGGWWGISAGDGPPGYIAPGPVPEQVDGTVWPVTALAAVSWLAAEIEADLMRWRASRAWALAYGKFGLSPFNLADTDRPWVGADLLGIDLGSFGLSVANRHNRTAWELWMRHPVARAALERLGLDGARGADAHERGGAVVGAGGLTAGISAAD